MIVLIILEHSYFRREKKQNLYGALFSLQTQSKGYNYFHAGQHQTGFYFSSHHEHFTVINSPDTDGMKNVIHCCTIESLFYTSVPT